MKLIKEISKIEYTTKEMIGYLLLAFRRAKSKYTEERLTFYLRELMLSLKCVEKDKIWETVDINLVSNFPFSHIVNCDELICYGLMVFYTLLKPNQVIAEQDIISQLEVDMRLYSSRNVTDEAKKILIKLKK